MSETRFYRCPVVGTGTADDPYRPLVADLTASASWTAALSTDPVTGRPRLPWCAVRVTVADHTAVDRDSRVERVPEDEAAALWRQHYPDLRMIGPVDRVVRRVR